MLNVTVLEDAEMPWIAVENPEPVIQTRIESMRINESTKGNLMSCTNPTFLTHWICTNPVQNIGKYLA